MTDYVNAERLRGEYLKRPARKTIINVCNARPNWNGCDYCDVYGPYEYKCWKQNTSHNCCHCVEMTTAEINADCKKRRNNND